MSGACFMSVANLRRSECQPRPAIGTSLAKLIVYGSRYPKQGPIIGIVELGPHRAFFSRNCETSQRISLQQRVTVYIGDCRRPIQHGEQELAIVLQRAAAPIPGFP